MSFLSPTPMRSVVSPTRPLVVLVLEVLLLLQRSVAALRATERGVSTRPLCHGTRSLHSYAHSLLLSL